MTSPKVIDLRCRPAFLHDFFGANPGSPGYETACHPDAAVYYPIYEACSRLGVPVFLMPLLTIQVLAASFDALTNHASAQVMNHAAAGGRYSPLTLSTGRNKASWASGCKVAAFSKG